MLMGAKEKRRDIGKLMLAMLGLTVVVAAILSSYASALGKPSPRHVPVAVTAPPAVLGELDASPQLRVYPVAEPAKARTMVEDRAAYGALVLPRNGPVTLLVANGGGHSVETVLVQLGQQLAQTHRTTLSTVDVAPTSPNDPNGTVEFYCIAFLFLGAAIGATVLGRLAGPVRGPRGALARLGLVALYTALLGIVVTIFADVVLGDLVGHFWFLFLTLWLFAAAVCLAVTGFSALAGPASIVLILVLISLGNPSSGGPVPRPLAQTRRRLFQPPPVLAQDAALSALRGVQYSATEGSAWRCCPCLIWVLPGLARRGAAGTDALSFPDGRRPRGARPRPRPVSRPAPAGGAACSSRSASVTGETEVPAVAPGAGRVRRGQRSSTCLRVGPGTPAARVKCPFCQWVPAAPGKNLPVQSL